MRCGEPLILLALVSGTPLRLPRPTARPRCEVAREACESRRVASGVLFRDRCARLCGSRCGRRSRRCGCAPRGRRRRLARCRGRRCRRIDRRRRRCRCRCRCRLIGLDRHRPIDRQCSFAPMGGENHQKHARQEEKSREDGGRACEEVRGRAPRHESGHPAAAHAKRAALAFLQEDGADQCDREHEMNDEQNGLHGLTMGRDGWEAAL